MNNLKTVSPKRAAELVRAGALLLDIREADEHARENIPGAEHHALSRIDQNAPIRSGDDVVIFHCRSGARTKGNAARLAAAAPQCETYILDGGLEAWKKAGLPVSLDRSKPIDIMRQVQIGAGSLILIGTLLSIFAHPGWIGLAMFVGAGLLVAGTTGFCGMAVVLEKMPWNRARSK